MARHNTISACDDLLLSMHRLCLNPIIMLLLVCYTRFVVVVVVVAVVVFHVEDFCLTLSVRCWVWRLEKLCRPWSMSSSS